MNLKDKKIVVGITGGIAAYKCAHLVRLLIKEGATVRVVMTESAKQFVTPQTLSVLSKNEVISEFYKDNGTWNSHVELGEWADAVIVAPLTANTMAKFATGICDNILCAVYLSARSSVFLAPAMDLDMYQHSTTKNNIRILKENGNVIIPAESGELASGLIGEGRMAEPETIIQYLNDFFQRNLPFKGKRVLISAGPTFEAIDPVRFIGNRSSGKTGIAIAEEFSKQGADVVLVLGPTHLKPNNQSIKVIPIESAEQMYAACIAESKSADIIVMSAAVADYRPENEAAEKIKKTEEKMSLGLVKTKDILADLGKQKSGQIIIGFALETQNAVEYGKKKLNDKNLDLIIINTTSESNPAFGSDFNKITIIDKHNNLVNFEFKSKTEIAGDIVGYLNRYMKL